MKIPWNGTATAITGIASVVALCFGAWFAITGAIADEASKRQMSIDEVKLQQKADDVDFEIYKVAKQMDEIEAREANGSSFHGDDVRLKQLQRQLDILIRRQADVLERLESKTE